MTRRPFGPDGRSFPLGATVAGDGVNVSVFSKGSTAVHVLLFDSVEDASPARVFTDRALSDERRGPYVVSPRTVQLLAAAHDHGHLIPR